jgi:hypothetical protein
MITLLASIAGFISSIIPEILKFLRDRNDKRHELNVLDRQIEYSKNNQSKILDEIDISRDLAEQASLYSTYKSGINWVDALNGSVRPVLAYSFFIMYVWIKFVQYKTIKSTALIEYIDIIWSVDDQAIFAGIISFYFGQRTFSKLWKNKYA